MQGDDQELNRIAHPIFPAVSHPDNVRVSVCIDKIDDDMHAVRMNTHRRRKFGSKTPHLRGVAQEIEYPCEIRVIRFGFVVTKRLGPFDINTNNVRFGGM